nr:MAG TPA: hypothetical protein [Caudoviricetes sp.]
MSIKAHSKKAINVIKKTFCPFNSREKKYY